MTAKRRNDMTTETRPHVRLVHDHFGLSYANYLVLHRTLLQSMPEEWQARFVEMLEQLDEAFRHVPQPRAYTVVAGEEKELGELSSLDVLVLKGYGITLETSEEVTEDGGELGIRLGARYYVDGGWIGNEEMESDQRIIVPGQDPIPHYDRGRAYVEPRITERGDAEGG